MTTALATKVLSVLTDLRTRGFNLDDVEIHVALGDAEGSRLWGRRVTEAYWVEPGHAEIVHTIPL